MTANDTHARLYKLQRRIFKSLQTEATRLMGPTPSSILRYEQEFHSDFRGEPATPSSKKELVAAIRQANVVYVADYHTFPQAQRTALRLMRDAITRNDGWAIGLELVSSEHQAALDAFQAGKLSLEQFHEEIQYEVDWGFPWSNYAPIFEWAREKKIPLVALNQPSRGGRNPSLEDRDRWAARLIVERLRAGKRAFVLYGELHVARRHLPAEVAGELKRARRKKAETVIVHQNHDRLYWRLAREGHAFKTDVFRLQPGPRAEHNPTLFCVLSSTPWSKLQSLVSWVDGEEDSGLQGGADYLSLMHSFGGSLAQFLKVPAPSFESLSVSTIETADATERLARDRRFSAAELAIIRAHVQNNLKLYIPQARIAYLGSPSPNAAAELAAIHLQREITGSDLFFAPEVEDFFRIVLEAAFGFFGSLILNHRRKCDLPDDHVRRLQTLELGEDEQFPQESHGRKLVLSLYRADRQLSAYGIERIAFLKKTLGNKNLAFGNFLAARYLGQIHGKRLHAEFLLGGIFVETLRRIFLPGPEEERSALQRYIDLVRLLAPARIEPSKQEKL